MQQNKLVPTLVPTAEDCCSTVRSTVRCEWWWPGRSELKKPISLSSRPVRRLSIVAAGFQTTNLIYAKTNGELWLHSLWLHNKPRGYFKQNRWPGKWEKGNDSLMDTNFFCGDRGGEASPSILSLCSVFAATFNTTPPSRPVLQKERNVPIQHSLCFTFPAS